MAVGRSDRGWCGKKPSMVEDENESSQSAKDEHWNFKTLWAKYFGEKRCFFSGFSLSAAVHWSIFFCAPWYALDHMLEFETSSIYQFEFARKLLAEPGAGTSARSLFWSGFVFRKDTSLSCHKFRLTLTWDVWGMILHSKGCQVVKAKAKLRNVFSPIMMMVWYYDHHSCINCTYADITTWQPWFKKNLSRNSGDSHVCRSTPPGPGVKLVRRRSSLIEVAKPHGFGPWICGPQAACPGRW